MYHMHIFDVRYFLFQEPNEATQIRCRSFEYLRLLKKIILKLINATAIAIYYTNGYIYIHFKTIKRDK